MGEPVGLRCIRCGTEYPTVGYYHGCPSCLAEGHPANLIVQYDYDAIRASFDPHKLDGRPWSQWRYHELLPVDLDEAISIGEGMTPLLKVDRLGEQIGLRNLYIKVDGMNPTWSFKDRLASTAVSFARKSGAQVITGSSSGNAGAATAAYSARGGLPCVMFTTQQFPIAMKVQMGVYGTKLIAVPTVQDRWRMVDECVKRLGWFPVTIFVYPLVGSSPYGIEGYKTIAFELFEQLGKVPDRVVFPVGAGDAFYGAWKGFNEYRQLGFTDRVPKMDAAEVFGPVKNALDNGLERIEDVPWGPTVGISVGLYTSALQALHVVRDSNGWAGTADDAEMIAMQQALAANEGVYAEMSSVLSLAVAAKKAAASEIDPDDLVVCVLTSSGLKDPQSTLDHMTEIPLVEPSLDRLIDALHDVYGFDVGQPAVAA
jgi:threonine synthase